jgi:hypothetical protein
MENLGHGSNAVTRAYAKKAKVLLPSLEEYEQKVVPLINPDTLRQASAIAVQTARAISKEAI